MRSLKRQHLPKNLKDKLSRNSQNGVISRTALIRAADRGNLNGNAELDSIQPRIWGQYIPPTRRNNKKHHNRIFIAMKPPNPNFKNRYKQSGISGTAQYQVHKEVPAPRI
jgi:hypothetical protein